MGMNAEVSLAGRSRVEPAHLGTADPGYNGGGTVLANDPQNMMSNYENIFGLVVRDIKWDEQRHKRHQRWHLPDVLKNSNSFLTDRVDGLITDSTSSLWIHAEERKRARLPHRGCKEPPHRVG
jgi:hypothetical protein